MDQPQLKRDLGPWAAASLVVGIIIGTGVFLKTAVMARDGGSAPWVLAAWIGAGVLSFTGALDERGARWRGGRAPAASTCSCARATARALRLSLRVESVLDRHAGLDRRVRRRHDDVLRQRVRRSRA